MLNTENNPITTAVLLAAGTGSRLKPLTNDAPKCLSEVNGTSILERLVDCLSDNGFQHLIVVVGYLDQQIRHFLDSHSSDLTVEYVVNPRYSTTNNLYSLWLARQTIDAPFLLVESDVVFNTSLLAGMLQPDKMATSKMQSWMDGTTVTTSPSQQVSAFQIGSSESSCEVCHKTVNMYTFSMASWQRVSDCLTEHVVAGNVNEYYETVFSEMVANGKLRMEAVDFDSKYWYEIDTLEDLYEAEKIFPVIGTFVSPLNETVVVLDNEIE